MPSFQLDTLLPKHIKKLLALKQKEKRCPHRSDWLRLHQNENRFGSIGTDQDLSAYPDPQSIAVREALGLWKELSLEHICVGAGIEELLDVVLRSFCQPGRDHVLALSPFEPQVQYHCLGLNLSLTEIPLNKYFQLVSPQIKAADIEQPKLLFLSNPNSISGQSLRIFDLIDLIDSFPGIVVVDESYIDFSNNKSLVDYVKDYPNLIVLQSFSKAWGLAGARIGVAYAHPDIISVLYAVKVPHSLSTPAEYYALKALRLPEHLQRNAQRIIEERESLKKALAELPFVLEVLDSDANFLLVRVQKPALTRDYLLSEGIVVAEVEHLVHCEQGLRITIGHEDENQKLLLSLRQMPSKTSTTRRFLKSLSSTIQKAGLFLGFFKKMFS
jgi:histidinol-phosphate aminotransferase